MSAAPDFRDVREQFRNAIGAAGLTPADQISADGKLHRFSSNGKRGDLAGWYVLHSDGIPSGAFGCWRLGLTESWRADIGRELTEAEREQHRQRADSARRMREQAEREQHVAARTRAATEWEAATPATGEHPYLQRKHVAPHGLRADTNGRLLVPVRDRKGELHSLQFIGGDGEKRFLPGGCIASNYYAIGSPGEILCIAEGFATAATVHEATGHAVAVAFNAGNLEAVARTLRAKLPKVGVIVCADDDVGTEGNPGVTKATAAALAVGGLLVLPDFGANRPAKATDLNDLAQHCGLESVRTCIANAKPPETEQWAEPLPLIFETESQPYPVDALPNAIGDAVREVAAFVQCPVPLSACSALSALSVAAQALVNVRRGQDLEGPVSLYLLAIAESGERKSECDRRFIKPLREWEAEQVEMLKPDLAKSRADLSAWEQECEAVRQNIKQARKQGDSTEQARVELAQLEAAKPEPVRMPRIVLESETAENLAWTLARPDGWPSAGLLSSEAGVIFGGHAMRRDSIMQSLALLNKLWSGEAHRVGRRTSESFELNSARLTMGLAVQPETVEAFFQDSHGLARGTGFAARFLIAWPQSTQGTRPYRDAPNGWPGLTAYQARIRQLLDMAMPFGESGILTPPPLDMGPQAFEAWRTFYDGVERELRADGDLANLRDVASKSAENCARIAALFHLFEHGPSGSIAAEYVASAARIVTWHLAESQRFLGGLAVPKPIANAVKLEKWLTAICRDRGVDRLTKREIMNRGPNSVRLKADLDAALTELTDAIRVRLVENGRGVELNPALLRA